MTAGNDNNVISFQRAQQAQAVSYSRLVPGQLTDARLASRITQTELAKKVGVSRQAISQYESGVISPDPAVMKAISQALEQPISFFTRPPRKTFGNQSTLFFRKVGADTKRRNTACKIYSEWLSETAFDFDAIANYPSVDLPSFEPAGESYSPDEIEKFAEETRKHFSLGLGPISNVLRLLEAKGVIVCRFTIQKEKIEAFSFWSGSRPFIFLASEKKSAVRARFDLAHELAHLCLHRWVGQEEIEDKNRLKEIESEADRFASAFLLPRRSFPNEVYSSRAEAFIDLKARWKVSIQAMVMRCKHLGIFDDQQTVNIYKQISYKKWRTNEPLDQGKNAIPFEHPLLLGKIANLVFQSGKLTTEEFIANAGLSKEVLEKLLGIPLNTTSNETQIGYTPDLK